MASGSTRHAEQLRRWPETARPNRLPYGGCRSPSPPSSSLRKNGTVTRRLRRERCAVDAFEQRDQAARSRCSRANSQSSTASSSSMPRALRALAQDARDAPSRQAASARAARRRDRRETRSGSARPICAGARAAANNSVRFFRSAAVVEIEQRVFGGAIAGDRVDIVQREQIAAAEARESHWRVASAHARVGSARAAEEYCALRPRLAGGGARRDQQMRLAAADAPAR